MRVSFLGIADGADHVTRPVEEVTLELEGLRGDRHAGLTMIAGVRQDHLEPGVVMRNSRQLSVLSEEELEATARALGVPRVDPRWVGANVVVVGSPELTRIAPSTRLQFPSGAVMVVDGENEPCTKAGRVVARELGDDGLTSRYVKAAWRRRGIVGWVEAAGTVRVGDPVTVIPR